MLDERFAAGGVLVVAPVHSCPRLAVRPPSTASPVPGIGAATVTQPDPIRCTTSVCCRSMAASQNGRPSASATPLRLVKSEPTDSSDDRQTPGAHCSTSARPPWAASSVWPTAHRPRPFAATASRYPLAPPGAGAALSRQVEPFQCSTVERHPSGRCADRSSRHRGGAPRSAKKRLPALPGGRDCGRPTTGRRSSVPPAWRTGRRSPAAPRPPTHRSRRRRRPRRVGRAGTFAAAVSGPRASCRRSRPRPGCGRRSRCPAPPPPPRPRPDLEALARCFTAGRVRPTNSATRPLSSLSMRKLRVAAWPLFILQRNRQQRRPPPEGGGSRRWWGSLAWPAAAVSRPSPGSATAPIRHPAPGPAAEPANRRDRAW